MTDPGASLAALPPVRERISHRARHLRIEVRAGGEIWLVIPYGVSRAQAYAFLAERAQWVSRHAARLRAQTAPAPIPLRFDGHDRLRLRGTDTPLRIRVAAHGKPALRAEDDGLCLWSPPTALGDIAKLRACLSRGLRELARRDAQQLLAEEAPRLNVGYRGPRIADQKSLWGSCSARGLISLNWRLVMAPPEVLRYVVVHELCHRRHHDHSPRFWRLVQRQMPEFEAARRWLRRHGGELSRWLSA